MQRCRVHPVVFPGQSRGEQQRCSSGPAGLPEPHSLDPLGSHAAVCLSLHLSPVQEQQCHQVPAVTCPCRLPLGSSLPSPAAWLAGALANTPASRMWRLSFLLCQVTSGPCHQFPRLGSLGPGDVPALVEEAGEQGVHRDCCVVLGQDGIQGRLPLKPFSKFGNKSLFMELLCPKPVCGCGGQLQGWPPGSRGQVGVGHWRHQCQIWLLGPLSRGWAGALSVPVLHPG